MDPRTHERVEQWDSRPFRGGYDGLSDLADDGFSGAVTANGTCLFLLNGRVIGVFDGDIEDFQDASGTVYQAPHPSVPLLCAMEEYGGETRAKYYTNDTPLEEVDSTLRNGSFTGYVMLSENVLSGDYYLVYYGGRRMAAAYIGNSERLVTGDEAFERAVDEVGIYTVNTVDIEVTDVPGAESEAPTTDGSAAGTTGSSSDAGTDIDTDTSVDTVDTGADTSSTAAETETDVTVGAELTETGVDPINVSDAGPGAVSEDVDTDPIETPTDDDRESPPGRIDDGSDDSDAGMTAESEESTLESDAGATAEPDTATTAGSSSSGPDPAEVEAAAEQLDQSDISWTDESSEPESAPAPESNSGSGPELESSSDVDQPSSGSDLEKRLQQEEQWRETRSIPSIDPEKTSSSSQSKTTPDSGSATSNAATGQGSSAAVDRSRSETDDDRHTSRESADTRQQQSDDPRQQPSTGTETAASESGASQTQEQTNELAERIERLESRREDLETKATELASERDQLREENEELSTKVDRLQSRIEQLEADQEGEGQESSFTTFETTLTPDRALSGTNLFVRYDSKSQPTLETAHQGEADRSDVKENLRLEHHTEFDASEAGVDGEPYEEFLASTIAYQFVEWLTERALYEIRDTGHANGLADLYDAIPRIDRAELDATVSLADDDTENVPDEVRFDVVAFDKRGNPLVLATLNDSREPVTEETLTELEERASAVKVNYPDLAAAFSVTSSYFEPGALEVTEKATSSGFLSRGSKLSYVNPSRKDGYHLCLVESRSEGFHMNVPEL